MKWCRAVGDVLFYDLCVISYYVDLIALLRFDIVLPVLYCFVLQLKKKGELAIYVPN